MKQVLFFREWLRTIATILKEKVLLLPSTLLDTCKAFLASPLTNDLLKTLHLKPGHHLQVYKSKNSRFKITGTRERF